LEFFCYLADWRYRHAGLMALSATGEGCHKEMSVILDDLVNGILVFLKDSVKIFRTLFSFFYGIL